MSIPNLILIISLFIFFLGFYVLRSDPRKRLNRYFSFGTFMIGIWVLLNYFFSQYNSEIFLRLIYAHAPFLIISTLTWVALLNTDHLGKFVRNFNIVALIANTAFAFLLLFDPEIISNVQNYTEYSTGALFNIYTIYVIILFLVLISYMIYLYFHSDKDHKKKFILISIGIGIIILVSTTVGFVLPAFGISQFNILDSASSIFFVLFGAYSIAKNKFLDVKIFITEIISYTLLILLFSLLFLQEAEVSIFLKIALFLALIYGVITLINSVQQEVKQKEKLQDLTQQLAQANAHLKEVDQMKTEFVSLASHELLTPVSAIEGYLSMILDEKIVKVADPKLQEYLDRIYTSAKRLARLIADMLNISRIEEGRLLVQKQATDLNILVSEVITELKFKAEEHKQKMVFANPGNYPTYADPDKIKEVLINLIGNSIKYSKDPGTITVKIEVVPTSTVQAHWAELEQNAKRLSVDEQEAINSAINGYYREFAGDQQYMIMVKDQGIGIPKEELPKLFKKFHRVGDFSTAESQGTGLGLYISKALVELHHGRIWPDSEGHDKGSTFSFTLPLLESKDQIEKLEENVPRKGDMKPLAKPMQSAEDI